MRPTLIYIQLDQLMEHLGIATILRFPLSGMLMAGRTAFTSAMCSGSLPMEDESKSPDMSSWIRVFYCCSIFSSLSHYDEKSRSVCLVSIMY